MNNIAKIIFEYVSNTNPDIKKLVGRFSSSHDFVDYVRNRATILINKKTLEIPINENKAIYVKVYICKDGKLSKTGYRKLHRLFKKYKYPTHKEIETLKLITNVLYGNYIKPKNQWLYKCLALLILYYIIYRYGGIF